DERLEPSRTYLQNAYEQVTASVSLCWVVLGLVAQGLGPSDSNQRLAENFAHYSTGNCPAYIAALLSLAALREDSPLIQLPRTANRPAGVASYPTRKKLFEVQR